MRVTVHYYGQLQAAAGRAEEEMEVAEGTDLSGLVREIVSSHGDACAAILLDEEENIRPSVIVVVNGTVADRGRPVRLAEGDEVRLLPAIAGG